MLTNNLAFLLMLTAVATQGVLGRHGSGRSSNRNLRPRVMKTVAVPRHSYGARQNIKAAYRVVTQQDKLVETKCVFQTTRPTINLDNFSPYDIQCDSQKVEVQFRNATAAKHAHDAWSATDNFAVIFGHEWGCKDDNATQMHMRAVRKVLLNTEKLDQLVLLTDHLDPESLVAEVDLDMHQFNIHNVSMRKRSAKNYKKVFPLNANYNPATGSVIDSNRTIFNTASASMMCHNCHTRGEAELSLHIKGSLFLISYYKVELHGSLKANLDIHFRAHIRQDFMPLEAQLFSVPLTPVTVPGLFNIGPQLYLSIGLSLGVDAQFEATTGFDLDVPLNLTIESLRGLASAPKRVTHAPQPTFNVHPFKATKDNQVRAGIHLIPGFDIGVTLLSRVKLGIDLRLDNELGVQVSNGSLAGCDDNNVRLQLYRRHSIQFIFRALKLSKTWPLWDSARRMLKCSFCDVCMRHSRPSLPQSSTQSSPQSSPQSSQQPMQAALSMVDGMVSIVKGLSL
ncbi:hypothetical protein RI367_003309 [Sorochytrium milnesiophthora]